jgi:uncharacterized protein with HEPN domain
MSGDEDRLRVDDYLTHMLDAIRLVRSYTDGLSKAGFIEDKRTQQAVILNLIILGEAASRRSANHAEFVAAYADIPWNQMRGMRNRMAHGYFDINLDIVWETVRKSLPKLEDQLVVLRAQ